MPISFRIIIKIIVKCVPEENTDIPRGAVHVAPKPKSADSKAH